MMRGKLLFLSVSLILLNGSAYAASSVVVANLKTPLPDTKEELVGDVVWRCVGATCAIVSDGGDVSPSSCHSFAKEFGPVTSFGSSRRQLTSTELDTCNDGVAPAASK